MPPQDRDGRALRLLPSLGEQPLGLVARAPLTAPRRPGERREGITFVVGPALRALVADASDERVDLDLAVTVTVERWLAERRLTDTIGHEAPTILEALDAVAGSARADTFAGDAAAAYVRSLLARRRRARMAVEEELLVAVPMRLVDLLEPRDAEQAASRVRLPAALQWELAAAVHGQSILEWAGWQALRAMRARG